MTDFQAIADRVEIEALRGEFTDAAMMRDRPRLAALFTPDGVLRMPNIPVELVGQEEIRVGGERLQSQWDFFVQTTHPGTIQLDGDTATGRTYIQELARTLDGRQGLNFAIYHDRYRRTRTAGGSPSGSTRSGTSTPHRWQAQRPGRTRRPLRRTPPQPTYSSNRTARPRRLARHRARSDRHHPHTHPQHHDSPGGTVTTPTAAALFTEPAPAESLERAAAALTAHGFAVEILDDTAAARTRIKDLIPEGASVFTSASETLRLSGIDEDINTSGRYEALKPRVLAMDRATGADDIRHLLASPDVVVGSVAAVTETGSLVVASASGSQIPAYGGGAARAIWIVGAQKVVPDLGTALRRVEEHALPLETARAQVAYGQPSAINRLLVLNAEYQPGRGTVLLLREAIGF